MPEDLLPAPFPDRPCPFITFYSFKGGVGRSMAVINVAGIVASRGFRVLVIDMDLEAPGISYLANTNAGTEAELQPGFVDFMVDAIERGGESDLFAPAADNAIRKYCACYELPEAYRKYPEACLHVMPAGILDENYASRLEKLNLPFLYKSGSGLALIKAFKQVVQESKRFDYVFIDSRTGFSDESGICTRDLADYLMIVSGLNRQNVEGTAQFLAAFRAATDGRRDFRVILSPVPNGEDALVDERQNKAQEAYSIAWGESVSVDLQIPYHPQLALTEEPHIFRRRKGYLYESYQQIEKQLLRMIGDQAEQFAVKATKALEAKDYQAVQVNLRHAVRLDDGQRALESFAHTLAQSPPLEVQASGMYEQLIEELEPQSWAHRSLAFSLHQVKSPTAELFYRKILAAFPKDPDVLANFAVFLKDVRGQHDEAEVMYRRTHEVDPKNAMNLGNFALFLTNVRGRHDEAEVMYRRAIEEDPKRAGSLGNFALFLTSVRGRHDEAEMMYRRAIEADPKRAGNLGNFALFLTKVRGRHDEAEVMYRRAIEADPKQANSLGNFAVFLTNVRGQYDEAEIMYRRAIEADSKQANSLGNFANFLKNVRGQHDEAEVMYRRGIEADPKDANSLCNFANFLTEVRKQHDEAEVMYRRALAMDPKYANNLGNFAKFYFAQNRHQEGLEMLAAAFANKKNEKDDLVCELHFYAYAHAFDLYPNALWRLKKVLTAGVRSKGWKLGPNVDVARNAGHPEPELLAALARVIAMEADIEVLEAFAAWRDAGGEGGEGDGNFGEALAAG